MHPYSCYFVYGLLLIKNYSLLYIPINLLKYFLFCLCVISIFLFGRYLTAFRLSHLDTLILVLKKYFGSCILLLLLCLKTPSFYISLIINLKRLFEQNCSLSLYFVLPALVALFQSLVNLLSSIIGSKLYGIF